MSFPFHDPVWREVAEFVLTGVREGDRVLAPDVFRFVLDDMYRDVNTHLQPDVRYDWVVVRRDDTGRLSHRFLRDVLVPTMRPVFVNEGFLVWHHRGGTEPRSLPTATPEVLEFLARVLALPRDPEPLPDLSDEQPLPDPGRFQEFVRLRAERIGPLMDAFWDHGGYEWEISQDVALLHETDRVLTHLIGDVTGLACFDAACGDGKSTRLLVGADSVWGVDISQVAVALARRRFADRTEFRFEPMDVESLDVPDASFDLVTFVEAIEHVLTAERVLAELARVTRPGGRLILTSANRDSLHLIMTRKLGYPEFRTSFQHVREFTFAEVWAMLEALGFEITDSAGIFLYPYWGIPGVDQHVRHLTDHDPEVVEVLRVLGERAGPEYAFEFAIAARKAG